MISLDPAFSPRGERDVRGCAHTSFGGFRRTLFAATLMCLGTTLPAQPNSDDTVVSLPPLIVEEKGRPLQWRYFELPGLEILSVCDDDVSQKLVQRHIRLEELLRVLLPDRFRVRLAVPEAYILFNEQTGRARSREVIAEMVNKAGARLAADGTVILPPRVDGFMGRRPQRIRILPNIRLADTDAVRVFAILRDTDGAMTFTFSKERTAFLLSRRTPPLPDWFVDGLLALYEQTQFHENAIAFLPATWISADESTALARDPDWPRTLLPMEELFTTRRLLPVEEAQELDRVWRAQSALFVRWALSDREGGRRDALWKWIECLETTPPGEAAFRECFGIGFSDARDRLSDYVPVAVSQRVMLTVPKSGPVPRIKFRAATDLEVARIRGDWERLQIPYVRRRFPALTDNYIAQARQTLRRVYDRGERDPRLLAVLGLTECDAGLPEAGREFLEAAVRGEVVRPRAYLELASLNFNELQRAGEGRKWSAEEVSGVLALLLRARLDDPPLAELYALFAHIWTQSAAPPSSADYAIVEEGVRLYPGVVHLVMRAIHLHVSHGSFAPAAELANIGMRHARDPAVRGRFERIRAELIAISK